MLEHMNKPCVASKLMIIDRKANEDAFKMICTVLGEDPDIVDDNIVMTLKVTYNKLTQIKKKQEPSEDENEQTEEVEKSSIDIKNMTKDQMIDFIKNNHHVHITHRLFDPDEYIYSNDDGVVLDEKGYVFEDWDDYGPCGISLRNFEVWQSGWYVKEWHEKEAGEENT